MQTDVYSTIPSLASLQIYIEQFLDIRPRLCILHKWSHYNGYGVHLTCNENWRGLRINEVESNSPAESAGLLRGDIVFAINGHPTNNNEFFKILSLVQRELAQDQLRFLVLDRQSAQLVQQYQMNISENDPNCIRKETTQIIQNSTDFNQTVLYDVPNKENKVIGHDIHPQKELRMCSITLSPSKEPIGIYLRTDTVYSHIITYVRPNSLAARAGIKQDDCIISLNGIFLLNISFEDVLYFLAKSRKEIKLNFLVAQKSYLLQLSQEQLVSKIHDQITQSSDLLSIRKRTSSLPTKETRENIYQQLKYEHDDRLSFTYACSNLINRKKNRGQFFDKIGPIIAFGSAWSLPSDKTSAYSSIRADLYGRKSALYEIPRYSIVKNTVNPVQTGIFISSPKSRTHRLADVNFSDNEQHSTVSSPLVRRFTKLLTKTKSSTNTPSPILKRKLTIRKMFYISSSTPTQSSPAVSIREKVSDKSPEEETNPLDSVASENLFNENDNHSDKSTQSNPESVLSSTNSYIDDQEVMVSKDSEFLSNNQQKETPSSTGTFYIPDDTEVDENDINTPQMDRESQYLQVLFGLDQLVPPILNLSSGEESPNSTNNSTSQPIDMASATISISELPNCGYEIHQIQLVKPIGKTPIGFKLTKQADSLQYTMTAIVEGSPADQAGFKVDDWLIQIEDKDIRLTDLHDVLKEICRLFLDKDSINIIVGRKKTISPQTEEQTSHNIDYLSSVGLSNLIQTKDFNSSTPIEPLINRTTDPNPDKFCSITLRDSSGLYFDSIVLDDAEQTQVHYVNRIQPISAAYRAGLRNYDRILTVNDIDVTKTLPQDLELMFKKSKPLYLIIVRDPEYFKTIENIKQNQLRKTLTSTIYETVVYQQSKELNYVLFNDDQGPLYVKYCIVKKESSYDALGFRLNYENNVHIIRNIENNFPGYQCGLRDNDIILFLNKRNVQQMTHEELKRRLRPLVFSSTAFDLIVLNELDLPRYRDYQNKRFIDWLKLFSKIQNNLTDEKEQSSYTDQLSNPTPDESSTNSVLAGARICLLDIIPDHSMGFSVEGGRPPPYRISKVQPDSPAEKAGLQVNDVILSINGQSVMEKTYEETLQIIRNSLQEKCVQFVVNQLAKTKQYHSDRDSDLSLSSSEDENDDSEKNKRDPREDEPAHRGANYVQLYQRQRSKELSYAVRHCHISTTNPDGTSASTFGFELSEDLEYQYPIISRVNPKSPGERSGLQTDDVLIKVNNRKTKGANIEKVKKAIDKALPAGRIEMLVIDKEAFKYCLKTNRKFKEPYIKVKHIFPRSRSSITYQSLPLIAARNSLISQDSFDQSGNLVSVVNHRYLSSQSEYDEDNFKALESETATEFDLPSLTNTVETVSHVFPQNKTQDISITNSKSKSTSPNPNDNEESILDFVLTTVNSFFNNFGTDKSINLDYDIPPDRPDTSKTYTPLLTTFLPTSNLPKPNSSNTESIATNQLNSFYDVIREPRRCVLKLDPDKGLGFILSAMGDYDHTITAIDKDSIADVAGLQVNDELVEIDGINVRNIEYEKVIDMLVQAMQTKETIEIKVINSQNVSNGNNNTNNNNNNNSSTSSICVTSILGDDSSDRKAQISLSKRSPYNTSHPGLYAPLAYLNTPMSHIRSESVPGISTGLTASPNDFHRRKSIPISSDKETFYNMSETSKKDAPVARLCRIQKFPSSPFYGFFLCSDRKKPGRVFVSNIKKHSSAAICGLRDGDHIIEVNGTNIQNLTYETILNIIKMHMDHEDLELLVLDKKSLHWYEKRNFPITSQTLPTIVHIEPIINNLNTKF